MLQLLIAAFAFSAGAEAAPPPARAGNRLFEAPRDTFGFLIEPWVGGAYGSHSGDLTGSVATTESVSLLGPAFGLQAGVIWGNWHFTARGQYFMLSNSSLAASPKNYGAGIGAGFTFPSPPLRLWLGFNFMDEYDDGVGNKLSANCVTLGAGWYFTDKISVNLEYNMRTYGKVLQSGSQVEPTFSNFTLSLSRPFTLGVEAQPDLAKGLKSDSAQKKSTDFGF